jgi:hypothetical protein
MAENENDRDGQNPGGNGGNGGGGGDDGTPPEVVVPPGAMPALREEMEAVRRRDQDGLLRPAAVVEYARANPQSVAHGLFEWDDAAAAAAHRLNQARGLIRSVTVVELTRERRVIRAYVSVATDRVSGGGYRPTSQAQQVAAYRHQLVEEALRKVERLQTSYAHLPELNPMFAEINEVVLRFRAERMQPPPAVA